MISAQHMDCVHAEAMVAWCTLSCIACLIHGRIRAQCRPGNSHRQRVHRSGGKPSCLEGERYSHMHAPPCSQRSCLFQGMQLVQVLSNISQRLADMHGAGFVHRDLKPANVMWLPRQNRWTVIDFGCIARVGDAAPLNFTLMYAAPEVVHAFVSGLPTIRAAPALDAWALGVMAFELLTGAPAFDLLTAGASAVRTELSVACQTHFDPVQIKTYLLGQPQRVDGCVLAASGSSW